MRLLYAWLDRRRKSAAHRESASDAGRISRGHGRQHLPLHGLRQNLARLRTRRGRDGAEKEMSQSTDKLDEQVAQLHVASKSSSAYESGPTKVVGKSAARLDAVGKATGETKYGQDLFDKKFLFAKVLRAAYPHADILAIDTRE